MSCQGDMQLPLLLSAWRGHRLMVRDPSFAPFWKSVAPVYLFYPPTPAFAKAGAAPGTTAGVEPVLKSPFASMAPSYTPPAICFSRRSSLPFARPPSNAPACRAKAALPATGPSHLFFTAFKPAVCPPSNASEALPRQLSQLQAPALPRQLSQLQAPAICF